MESRTFLQGGKGSSAPPAPPTSMYASLAAPSPACFPLLYGNYPFLSAAAAPFLPLHPCLLPPLPRSKQHFHPLASFADTKPPSPPSSNFQLPQLAPEKASSPKDKSGAGSEEEWRGSVRGCPLCGVTLSSGGEWAEHFQEEVDRLAQLSKNKEWLRLNDPYQDLLPFQGAFRLSCIPEADKRSPEARKETFLRVQANRLNRLSRATRVCRKSPVDFHEHLARHYCKTQSSHHEYGKHSSGGHLDLTKSEDRHSVYMLGLSIQPNQPCAETASLCSNNRMDNDTPLSLVPSESQADDKTLVAVQLSSPEPSTQDGSSTAVSEECIENLSKSRTKSPQVADPMWSGQSNPPDTEPVSTLKCLICLEPYRRPVVSVCCWHVHCEQCWLRSLGTKRLCPQCEAITSPADLRRIHL